MERGDEFEVGELKALCSNPVLAPIIRNLVLVRGEQSGFFHEGLLINYRNEAYSLCPDERLKIAHPVDLHRLGAWSNYQRELFHHRRIQPFKQVFRELYLPNSDELKEQTLSRRYAGHQIQPRKAAALLKSRGWLAAYEEGLQKVYYKEDIVATIYAMAGWFSPSEVEAPTIEIIRFEDRKTGKPLYISQVPKLVFSEVMRDVDLVVSVSHVGGVDPEASLSTIEIRKVILEELLKLLKLENVLLTANHAKVRGGVMGNTQFIWVVALCIKWEPALSTYCLYTPATEAGYFCRL
ncbi:protein of unknown function [Geosporobacter subterraneus DSM 17957]|uniref:DUF4132 domain-containing protein n=2 Tax=Geosporobacter TaxID=390805 RepID=A0A1M6PAJ8_9FIRM|nr:protein of unknown function [Geosporobacter subterraneus DSM 17957]